MTPLKYYVDWLKIMWQRIKILNSLFPFSKRHNFSKVFHGFIRSNQVAVLVKRARLIIPDAK